MNRHLALWRTALMLVIGLTLAVGQGRAGSAQNPLDGPLTNSSFSQAEEWEVTLRLPSPVAETANHGKLMEDDTVLIDESFEDAWPMTPWHVLHDAEAADVDWGSTDYRAAGGSFSIWCAAAGPDSPGPGGPAPTNTASWAVAGPFDLSEAITAELAFDLWLTTEKYFDVFMWLVSSDGLTFSGRATTTNTSGWERKAVSLADLGDGSAIGSDQVWIAFVYTSDRSNTFEGAYLDNVLLTADSGGQGEEGYTYTTDEDFALGTMLGTTSEEDTLSIGDDWDTFPFLWLPNTYTGSISKVDVLTGDELGRYHTGPPRNLAPGPVAVDLEGSCWVGNRVAGSVVKIGLEDNGGCVDADLNGTIDTSRDDNNNGVIEPGEILDWGADECVLLEVVLANDFEGVFIPGADHGHYQSNNVMAVSIDAGNDVWVGVADSATYYHLDGSSGEVLSSINTSESDSRPISSVVDSEGVLWSATWPQSWVLRIDPTTSSQTTVELSHGSLGLALDENRHLFVTGDSQATMSRLDLDNNSVDWAKPVDFSSGGIQVSQDNDVWVAALEEGTVTRYTNQGEPQAVLDLETGPNAIAVDGRRRVWVTGLYEDIVVRVDSATNVIDLETTIGDGGGRTPTGDMTGIVIRNLTSKFGTWTVIYDSLLADTPWGTLTWSGTRPEGTLFGVQARSSNTQNGGWSTWERAVKGVDLATTPPGRYIQIQVSLQQMSGDTSPTLKELTITPAAASQPPQASFTWSPEEPLTESPVQFTDTSTENPTSWQWSFGDNGSSSEANPGHTYAEAGTYVVTLEVSNDGGSDSVSQEITIAPAVVCTLDCTATAPGTGLVEEALFFQSTATPDGCVNDVLWSWSFGDEVTSTTQSPAHAYASAGDFTWAMTASVEDLVCSESGQINISEDGPEECVHTYWLPVASRTSGAAGSVWRTDLGVHGGSVRTAVVELRFHGPTGIMTRSLGVAVLAMVDLVDVVGWIAGDVQASGPIEVCADRPVTVSSRIYNLLSDNDPCLPGGTFGQYMAGGKASTGREVGDLIRLTQLRENDAFRTNIGLFNAGTEAAEIQITLLDTYGYELATYTKTLEPTQWWQDNQPFFNRAGRDDLDAGSAHIDVISGEGIFAYGSVIDNTTGDAMTAPMR